MDMFDLAGTLFGNRRDQVAQGSTLTATGSTASADGIAGIVIDADVTPAEGTGDEDVDQTVIDLPTSPDVAEGDEVIVTLVGDGPLKTPIVTANPGSGDRMAAAVTEAYDLASSVEGIAQQAIDVANATGQHFWPDTDGVHVTEATQDEWNDSTSTSYHSGANVLLNALGQLFRDGLNNILAIVSGADPGIAIYDGDGNDADNILALLTKSLIRIGGKFASSGTSTAKVQFFEDTSALTDLTAEHYVNTTTDPRVSHDLALSSTITDEQLPDGTGRTVTGNVEVWEQVYHEGSTYGDEVDVSLNGATTNRQYNVSIGAKATEASGSVVRRIAYAVADTLRLTFGTGSAASTSDFPMSQVVDELTEGGGTLSYASGFKAYQNDSARLPKWRRSGNVVSIRGAATPTSQIAANSATTMFTLPTAIRPSENIFGPRMQGSGMNSWYMAINANGTVQIERYGTTTNAAIPAGAWLPFFATYIID